MFPDIVKMYPSTDCEEAMDKVAEKYENRPSEHIFSKECVVKALRICNTLKCIPFNGSTFGLHLVYIQFSRALAVSGFRYEQSKSELIKSKSINREDYLNEEKKRK